MAYNALIKCDDPAIGNDGDSRVDRVCVSSRADGDCWRCRETWGCGREGPTSATEIKLGRSWFESDFRGRPMNVIGFPAAPRVGYGRGYGQGG